MKNFSTFLRERRKELGLTQQDVADKLSLSNKAVSKWETGECFPDVTQLVPLSELLGCTVDELLRGQKNKAKPAEVKVSPPEQQTMVKKPWNKFLLSALLNAAFGVIVFFLFNIAFDNGRTSEVWSTGILLAFLGVSFILLISALISYCLHSDEK